VKACPSDPLVKSKTSVLYSFKVWS